MYPRVSANMIVGAATEIYLRQSIESIYGSVDEIVVVANTNNANSKILESYPKIKVLYREFKDFATARNIALENSAKGSQYILWVDADEVHFAGKLSQFIIDCANKKADAGRSAFFHFIKDFKHFQSIDDRFILLRKGKFKWEGLVDEYPLFVADKIVEHHSEYRYHHYGYTKPQRELWQGWMERAALLGETDPWFKDKNPDTILDERKVIEYIGDYPLQMKGIIK